jgi:exodeoxyribonuclease-3
VLAGQAGWNGVAVIARDRPELVLRELPGAAECGARFVVAKVHGLEVASVYVPNGKTLEHADYAMKLGFLHRLAEHVEGKKGGPEGLVLGGDFNVCWTALDSYGGTRFEGRIFHTERERGLLDRIRAAGLVDLFRDKHPRDPGFSWWDYRAGAFHKNEGMRLDLLLATEPVARRVKEIYVDRDFRKKSQAGAVPSDHAPVVAVLEP